jgi:hypothetical protein
MRSRQQTQAMHRLHPLPFLNWEEKGSCILSRSVEVPLALCSHRPREARHAPDHPSSVPLTWVHGDTSLRTPALD